VNVLNVLVDSNTQIVSSENTNNYSTDRKVRSNWKHVHSLKK